MGSSSMLGSVSNGRKKNNQTPACFINEDEVLMSADEESDSSNDKGRCGSRGGLVRSSNGQTTSGTIPSQVPKFQPRRDRLGTIIASTATAHHRWQVTFRDHITKNQAIATVHEVESYKEFNKLDDNYDPLDFKDYMRRKQ